MSVNPYERLKKKTEEAMQGGGVDRLKKQREGGRLTARDRVEHLLDPGSFVVNNNA